MHSTQVMLSNPHHQYHQAMMQSQKRCVEFTASCEIPNKKRIDRICDDLSSISSKDDKRTEKKIKTCSEDGDNCSTEHEDTVELNERENAVEIGEEGDDVGFPVRDAGDDDDDPCPSSMDPELRNLIKRYVRSDFVINCLELAGFDTPAVLMCLNDNNLKQFEDFISDTCGLMTSSRLREHYLGPVFARHPSNFRLPTGAVCGLQLVVDELKRISASNPSTNATRFPLVLSESFNFGLADACAQTEVSFPSTDSGCPTSSAASSDVQSDESPVPSMFTPLESSPELITAIAQKVDHGNALMDCRKLLFDGLTQSAAANQLIASNSLFPSIFPSRSVQPSTLPSLDGSIDLDRLVQHSSASACRLAARQFVNANLVRGKHFDMEMECSLSETGQKRVTGIFYCHLCREKRERTCPVRFSIARNRYPVMSNVLSHLKTHFQYQTSETCVPARNSSSLTPNSSPPHPPLPQLLQPSENGFLTSDTFCNLMSQVAHLASSAANNNNTSLNGERCSPISTSPLVVHTLTSSSSNEHQH